jgi:hypothetical protein
MGIAKRAAQITSSVISALALTTIGWNELVSDTYPNFYPVACGPARNVNDIQRFLLTDVSNRFLITAVRETKDGIDQRVFVVNNQQVEELGLKQACARSEGSALPHILGNVVATFTTYGMYLLPYMKIVPRTNKLETALLSTELKQTIDQEVAEAVRNGKINAGFVIDMYSNRARTAPSP